MYIVMLGAPGSGKGTIGKILSKDMNLAHISTGDIFREQISNKTELGKQAESYISKGALVPDNVTIKMVETRLSEVDVKDGAILDGFPRTAVQAEALKNFLEENNPMQKRIAIELDVPDEEIIKRIVNRVTCSNKECGAIYNLQTRPPKQEGICDICGSALTKRADDNEETAANRIEVYNKETKPLIDYYEKAGNIAHIDGTIGLENVFNKIVEIVGE